jgi:hypothetical protein
VVEAWLAAIRAGEVEVALRLAARLRKPDSPQAVLRNLGYEISGARKNSAEPVILGIHRSGGWAAVGVRGSVDGKPSFPLYPVIQTPAGPRILIEIDLMESQARSRDFLNKTALSRLNEQPPAVASELRKLLQQHKQDAASPAR